MTGLLQLGAALLGNLSFRGKFTLIGAIMFGVIAILTGFLVHNLLVDIHTVQQQRQGITVIGKVVPVLIEVQKHRGLNSAYLGGDATALPKLQAINAKQESLIAAIDQYGGIAGLGAQAQWDAVIPPATPNRRASPNTPN
jgi:methyl-accepting chemotaxis protein